MGEEEKGRRRKERRKGNLKEREKRGGGRMGKTEGGEILPLEKKMERERERKVKMRKMERGQIKKK